MTGTRPWLATALAMLVTVSLLSAVAPLQVRSDAALQAALDRWASAPAHHGVSASVIFADGRQWVGTAGVEGAGAPIRPEHLFWLASITKTMTGAVILKLAEESRLSLDDPISRWLPARPNIDGRITVRQLMNHTSGVASYTGAILRTKSDPTYVFSADELLDTVPPMAFEPGTRTQYSNTAFVVLASVAERVTGQPMHRLLRERLWAPLGLTEIFMIGHEPPPGPVARAFNGTTFVQPLDNLSQASGGHGAGAVFASARTVARWGRALFTGTVVSPATQRAMRTLVPAAGNIPGESGAGLGIRGYNFHGRQQYGHSGGAVLGNSLFVFDPDTNTTVAVVTNQGQGADHFVLVPTLLGIATRPASSPPTGQVPPAPAANWPEWRGPLGTGEAPSGSPPVEFSETTGVRWKTAIPGAGASTPIVWGDTIYLQTAEPVGDEKAPRQTSFAFGADQDVYYGRAYYRAMHDYAFSLVAIDRATGAIKWRKVLRTEQPAEGRHPTNTFASASPATDGEHLFAFFGSRGLYALTMTGEVLWQKDFGQMETRNGWGEGATPRLYGNRLVVTWDHEGASFIAVLDKATGREVWRRERNEPTTWATPLVVPVGNRVQVITNGQQQVRAYDLETGDVIWYGPGLTFNSIPSPVAANGMAYLTSGFQGSVLLGVDLATARGDIAGGALRWRRDRDTPYVASPLLYRGTLYVFKHLQGIMTALDAATGAVRYGPVRLTEIPDLYASPVAADGRIYVAGRDGAVVVFRHGETFDLIAVNQLDDGFDASPAIVGDELYLRGRRALYRISR